jgi:hypothetical protein
MICLNQFDQIMSSHRKIAILEGAIHLIRGQRVMLDSDLAAIYGVSTRQLNQQLKRNMNHFPEDFAFQLGHEEFKALMSQFVTSKGLGRARSPSAPQRTARRSVPIMEREIGFHVRQRSGPYRAKRRFS